MATFIELLSGFEGHEGIILVMGIDISVNNLLFFCQNTICNQPKKNSRYAKSNEPDQIIQLAHRKEIAMDGGS